MAEAIGAARRRWTTPRRLATGWMIAAACLFAWWAAHYSSLIEDLGEWQFARFGSYRGPLTVAALVLLVAVPVWLIWWRQSRRNARAERERLVSAGGNPAIALLDRARRGAVRARLFAGAVAIAGALLAVGVALSTLYLPRTGGIPAAIRGGSDFVEGPAQLQGRWRVGRVARLHEDVVFASRTTYVAPVQLEGDAGGPLRLVTTVVPRPGGGFAAASSGVLVRRGTPRELRNLYEAVGVSIGADSYMLMRDDAQVRWRSWALAGQIAAVALLAAIAWLLSRRREQRLDKIGADQPVG